MSHNQAPQATLNTVAEFPADYFLENLVVRSDNSIVLTVLNNNEMWHVPAQEGDESVTPVHLYTFEQNATGIVELEPDVFLVMSSHFYAGVPAYLYKLDLRKWSVGSLVHLERMYQFPRGS